MKPRNLQTVIAYRDQELKIDLGKNFEGVLSATMARNTDVIENERVFQILDNRYLILPKENANDNEVETILGRWYFDVRQVTPDVNRILYTGTIFFYGNITQ